jgi:hypothetical protein
MSVVDQVANTAGTATVDGLAITVANFHQTATQVCATVTYLNTNTTPSLYDYLLNWGLQPPSGPQATPNPNGYIRSGQLGPSQSVTGPVCFDSTGQHGQFVLSARPISLGHTDRGIWLLQLP